MSPGDVVAERFELEHVAGSGGLGVVFAARDRLDGSRVALKVVRPDHARHDARFLREAEVLGRLRHPGIVRYVAHGRTPEGQAYLAMEWLEGEDLGTRLGRGPLGAGDTIALAARVAGALGAVHALGIVHRDVKPSNIFLVDGLPERATLLDFGVARVVTADAPMTRTGVRVGTPLYMAPEQVRTMRDVDARADVFALGCVLFECLTGDPPFRGEGVNEAAVLAKILFEDVPPVGEIVPAVPLHLERLVGAMLGKERSSRPADGAAVAEALRDASLDDRTASETPRARERARGLGNREQRLVSVVLAGTASPGDPHPPERDVDTPTVAEVGGSALAALGAAVRAFGGRREQLADGSWVVVLSGAGVATDRAAQAARLALAVRAALPDAQLVVATGRATSSERLPVGEVVDRAWSLLEAARERPPDSRAGQPVIIDELTGALVGTTFDLRRGPSVTELVSERTEEAPSRRLLGRATPMVGRDRDLAVLLSLLEESAREPAARAALVTAPAGFGKSRLCHELLRAIEAERRPLTLLYARGEPLRAGSPFELIGQAIRREAGIPHAGSEEMRHGALREWLARRPCPALDRTAAFLGEVAGAPAPRERETDTMRAARRDAVLMGDHIRRAWEDWVAAECSAGPVLVVLDDLQWGDTPSVRLIDAALSRLRDAPLMVVGFARPEVSEAFPRLWADSGGTEIRLRPLSHRASLQLVSEMLGPSATGLGERLATLAGGNAFLLEELIRSVAEGQDEELPETVVAMAHSRLDALEPEARRILRAASIFGESFSAEAIRALLDASGATDLCAWLATLAQREVIGRRGAEERTTGEEYAFRHSVLREAAYASLTDQDRTLGHRLAGRWLEANRSADAAVLAHHYDAGDDPPNAIRWHLRAAAHVVEGNDLSAGLRHVERAVALGAAGEQLGALRLLEAEVQNRRGESPAAAVAGLQALSLMSAGSTSWIAAVGQTARAAGRTSDRALLERLAADLRSRLGPSVGASFGEISAVLHLAHQLQATGLVELAAPLFAWLDSLPDSTLRDDPQLHGTLLRGRAARASRAPDHGVQLRLDLESVRLLEQAGDLRRAAMSRVGVGYAYLKLGAYDLAEVALLEAVAAAGRLGLVDVTALARQSLGMARVLAGRIEEGLTCLRGLASELAEQRSPRFEGETRIYVAIALQLEGEGAEAEGEANRAIELLGPASPSRPMALAVRARGHLLRGRSAEALMDAAEAALALERPGGVQEGEALVRLAWAEALAATGSRDHARAVIAEATDRLLDQAARVEPAELRETFLHRVPENAGTLELARALREASE